MDNYNFVFDNNINNNLDNEDWDEEATQVNRVETSNDIVRYEFNNDYDSQVCGWCVIQFIVIMLVVLQLDRLIQEN